MQTTYGVGDLIYIAGKIKSISINEEGTFYNITIDDPLSGIHYNLRVKENSLIPYTEVSENANA